LRTCGTSTFPTKLRVSITGRPTGMSFHALKPPLRLCLLLCSLANLFVPAPAVAQPPAHPEVLVVYNTNFPDSLTLANYYMAQRGIPAANLCAISQPSIAGLSMTDYVNTVKTPIRACLTNVGRTRVLYIVF